VDPRQEKPRSAVTPAPTRPAGAASGPAGEPGEARADREMELKFAADEATFRAALASAVLGPPPARPGWRLLRTTYFDTPTGRLQRKKVALRLRRVRARGVMTLKWDTGEGDLARGEIEVAAGPGELDLALFDAATQDRIRGWLKGEPLVPVYTTEVRRAVRMVERHGATVEVAFDRGAIVAGALKEPIREVELELKAGSSAGLIRLARELAASLPLRIDVRTKAARGARLIEPAPWRPVVAGRPGFGPQTSADESIRQVMLSCMLQFIGNWPGSLAGRSEGCVHQMRVALRRFRAALAMFNRTFPCEDFQALRQDAKGLASAMGEARDWDVFVGHVRTGPAEEFPGEPGLSRLVDLAEARAVAGHDAVQALLRDPATTRFVLKALDVAARRTWRSGLDAEALALLVGPVTGFAAQHLERLDRKVRKRGKRFASLPPAELHEVRIALKSVRYGADFFGHVFAGAGQARRYARRASALQDLLGLHNDRDVAGRLLQTLDLAGDREATFAAGLVMGWHGHAARIGRETLLDAWKAFLKADRTWRDDLPDPPPKAPPAEPPAA
jgi:triphosphatase